MKKKTTLMMSMVSSLLTTVSPILSSAANEAQMFQSGSSLRPAQFEVKYPSQNPLGKLPLQGGSRLILEKPPVKQEGLEQLRDSLKLLGPSGTGGGDEYVVDFLSTAIQEVHPLINSQGSKKVSGLTGEEFLKALDPKTISSTDHVYETCELGNTSGREVTMCFNQETNKYLISRTRYPLNVSSTAKIKMIAHEVFRKMKIEGDGYEVTSKLVMPAGFLAAGLPTVQNVSILSAPKEEELKQFQKQQEPANSAYSQLANMMRASAIDRAKLGNQTLKDVNEMIAEWVKKKMAEATRDVYSKGIIELDLGQSQDQWGNNYGAGKLSNNISYQQAYVKALNTSLSATGLGVLTVGTTHNEGVSGYAGVTKAFSDTSAYAFVGPVPGAEVKIADYSFKVMSFAQGLETMGQVYSDALAQLEADFRAEMAKKGIKAGAAEYMEKLNELFQKANIKFTITMFQDKESQDNFLAELKEAFGKAQSDMENGKKKIGELPPPFVITPPVTGIWTCRYATAYNPRPGRDVSRDVALAKARHNCLAAQQNMITYLCPVSDAVCSQE